MDQFVFRAETPYDLPGNKPLTNASMKTVYDVKGLTKRYARQSQPANDNLTFQVYEGEIFGILGDNGAGKSTLLRQLANLIPSSSGKICLFDEPLGKRSFHVPLQVGYMPQEPGALNHLSVAEAIYFTAHLRGMTHNEAAREQCAVLKLLDLVHVQHRDSGTLSGGERRLLRLAVALAASPPVLLLDEPTNDLDPFRRKQVWNILRSINRSRKATIIFITHDAIEAEKIIQRVAIMHGGRILAIGRPTDLKARLGADLRIDIAYEPSTSLTIPDGIRHECPEPGRCIAFARWHDAVRLLSSLGPDSVQDITLHSTTLEDLYLKYVEHTESAIPGSVLGSRAD